MPKRVFVRNHSYENVYTVYDRFCPRAGQGPNGNAYYIVILGFMYHCGSNLGQKPQRTSAELLKVNSSLHSLVGQHFEFDVSVVDFGRTGQHRKSHPPGTSNGRVPVGPRPVQDGDYSCGYGL